MNLMQLKIRLSGDLTVLHHGPPPDRAVAMLLVGLLSLGEEWTPRTKVAQLLYPESTSIDAGNALRQAIFRLKGWLGEDIVQSQLGTIRNDPTKVEADWGDGTNLVPWLEHPWADHLRGRPAPTPAEASHFRDYVQAVESTALVDRESARGILLGSKALGANLPSEDATRLLSITRPANQDEPLAFEHVVMRADLQYRLNDLSRASDSYQRAHRIAKHLKSPAKLAQTAAMCAFVSMERGEMGKAKDWMDQCSRSERFVSVKSLLINVQGAYLWNMERPDEAIALMYRTRPSASTDRLQQLHFWSNFSALCAESGDFNLLAQAEDEVQRLIIPSVDLRYHSTLNFAKAMRLMRQGSLDEAQGLLEAICADSIAHGQQMTLAYALEALAEVHAKAGESRYAKGVWTKAETIRKESCPRLTPRVAARKVRVHYA